MYSVDRHIEVVDRAMTSLNWVDMGVAYSLPSSSNEGGLLAHSVMRSSTSFETALYSGDSSQTWVRKRRGQWMMARKVKGLANLAPVLALRQGSRDDVDHELGRVVVGVRLDAVSGKVLLHLGTVLSEVAEVDRVATSSEKQESVELVEEKSGRLVDSDEHGLSLVGKLSEEPENVVRALSVKTRGGLCEKE